MSLVIERKLACDALAGAVISAPDTPPVVEPGPWLSGLLDQIDYGLVVLDEAATAVHVNRSAWEWLTSAAAPLRLQGGRLKAVAAHDSGRFHRALVSAVSRGCRALLAFGEGSEGVATAIGPLPSGCAYVSGLALLVIGRHHVCDPLTAQMFATRHGLTPAESEVLRLLCTGLAPREIAQYQCVALSTVRSHIRSIRSKTRARTIGTLMREVALLPPLGHACTGVAAMVIK